ncbi:MAG: hypothetical protein WCR33_02380 [Bacilli bacterium]
MPKLIVVTPRGELINEDFDIITVKGEQGEIGILNNRLPIIMQISDGFVKATRDKKVKFIAITRGVLDNNDKSIVTVASEEAALGTTYDDALANLNQFKSELKLKNKQKNVDFTKAEKDLAKSIRDSKASEV